jgi:hypothetical protein
VTFGLVLLAVFSAYLAFRFRRWRRLPERERRRDPLFGSRYGRFMAVCCALLAVDFVAFLVSFGHSFESEEPASWNVWLTSILLGGGAVLLGLIVLGVFVGPFVERRRDLGDQEWPQAR